MSYYLKKDEDSSMPLDAMTAILQEARVFNASPIKPRQCRLLLAKICCLLYQGDVFNTTEATDLFFGVTKLFQSQDPSLRQMVYLVIKELSGIAQDVIMVTSSLMKDMQPKSDLTHRANAIRALCRITDASMLQGVERFLKAAVVDRSHQVSSAALVGAYHFVDQPGAREVIKRWANEVQEAALAKAPSGLSSYISGGSAQLNQGSSYIVQYHALGLLYLIKQHDRMAVTKLVQTFGKTGMGSGNALKSPLAVCMLIRLACKVMEDDASLNRELYELLEGHLRHRSDMVSYEAARAICSLPHATTREIYPAVNVLQLLLSSQRPTLRFAAVRTLNMLAQRHPTSVETCNIDLENLVTDSNRSIATLAITTLLKTGNEASVDRLIKQISGFMSEISDEFKIIVVKAVRSLCLKFASKYAVMLEFLSSTLREEGGMNFKKEIVEAIFDICKFIPESKPGALSHLCEFIEDCEYPKLAARVLYFLGEEGPHMPNPTVYIRHIYNRLLLENAVVRAAAVSALAKFGANSAQADIRTSVKVLLTRCLEDKDDEVRDRAAEFLAMIEDSELTTTFFTSDSEYSLAVLERQLMDYCSNLDLVAQEPFSTVNVPKISKEMQAVEAMRVKTTELTESVLGKQAPQVTTATPAKKQETEAEFMEKLAAIPEFGAFGTLFKTSPAVNLTEEETEYVVKCRRHTFPEHIVFQFDLLNTIQDQWLENVRVEMTPADEPDEDGLLPMLDISAPQLPYNQPSTAYVAYQRGNKDMYATATFTCTLKFVVKDCDPTTGEPDEEGYEDEYQIEDAEVGVADYVLPSFLGDFDATWRKLGNELVETFELSAFDNLQAACTSIADLLGVQPVNNSNVVKEGAHVHTLVGTGLFLGGVRCAVRAKMTLDVGVAMELAIRGEEEDAVTALMSAIA